MWINDQWNKKSSQRLYLKFHEVIIMFTNASLIWMNKNFKTQIWNDYNKFEIWFVNNSSTSLHSWNNMQHSYVIYLTMSLSIKKTTNNKSFMSKINNLFSYIYPYIKASHRTQHVCLGRGGGGGRDCGSLPPPLWGQRHGWLH